MRRRFHNRRRIERCLTQWGDACALVANGLRAGLTLPQAFALVAAEAPPPLREEFQRLVDTMALGKSIDAACTELERRLPAEEVSVVAHAVAVLQSMGGNLVAVFDRVVAIVREQHRVRTRIRTLTTQGMLTGWIVAALPFVHLGLVTFWMPQCVRPLFTTILGRGVLITAIVLQGIGLWWMRRIVQIRL